MVVDEDMAMAVQHSFNKAMPFVIRLIVGSDTHVLRASVLEIAWQQRDLNSWLASYSIYLQKEWRFLLRIWKVSTQNDQRVLMYYQFAGGLGCGGRQKKSIMVKNH